MRIFMHRCITFPRSISYPVNAHSSLLGFYSEVHHGGNHLMHTEAGMSLLPKEIESHYLESRERERLSADQGELERLRTEAILARHLPPAPAVVVDVGGAAGVYAFPLAKQRYEVHLIDPGQLP